MLVIVGHGPSIVGKGLGKWLDEQTVVRMKTVKLPNSEDWGTRTDYLCGTSTSSNVLDCEFWLLSKKPFRNIKPNLKALDPSWFDYFASFKPKAKPSTGMRAIFAAIQFLDPKEIGLVGFDRMKEPDGNSGRWWDPVRNFYLHDAHTERKVVESLDVDLVWL